MRVAIHQPNYAPWCGYFAKMRACDVFVFLDDAQFSKGSFTNRVQINSAKGPVWMTVPVKHSGFEPINRVVFADETWSAKHRRALTHEYARTSYFREIMDFIEPIYGSAGELLSEFNMRLIRAIAAHLELKCEIRISSEIGSTTSGDARLIELVQRLNGTTYVSGPGGQKYQDEGKFAAAKINLEVKRYRPIAFDQGQGEKAFVPGLSVFDALFHLGSDARDLLTYNE